ncbi:RCC1/BLIP-II [Salix suchowensis]|nr:RCC1/BLIP-II [Salix suchowensis]
MSSPTPIIYSAGSNARGQLASGNFDDLHSFDICQFASEDLTNNIQEIVSISGGANHTVVLLRTQSLVELWGCGDARAFIPSKRTRRICKVRLQLLDIPGQHSALRNASPRLVAAAWETTYIIFTASNGNDVLVSLGANDYGDLGVGAISNSINMISFASIFSPLDLVRLRIEDLATGPHHIIVYLLATLSDGSERRVVAGWGAARHGQLGEVNASNGKVTLFRPHRVLFWTWGDGSRNQHSVILLRSGRIHTFGSDRKNQLAGVQSLVNIQKVVCTWNNTYAVRADQILSVGNNAKGQLGRLILDSNLPAAIRLSGAR